MKNDQIKKSLDNILPNAQEKEIMLNNIIIRKNKKNFFTNYKAIIEVGVLGLAACFCIILYKPSQNNDVSVQSRSINILNEQAQTFNYKNKCYEESIKTNEKRGKYLFTITDNDNLDGSKVYASKNTDTLIVLVNNEQKEFKICK